MQRESACPSVEQLRQLALGLVEGEHFDSLERHVLGCSKCVETISALEASDTVVQAVQSQPEVTRQLAPFAALIAACAASSRQFATSAGEHPTSASASADEPTSVYEATRPIASGPAIDHPTTDFLCAPAALPADAPEAESYDFLGPPQSADELGRLGGYRLLRVLGAGGMGTVFQAEDVQLKRRVAIKVMKPALAASRSSRQRFLREAQTAAAVEHDNIVPIYQVGEDRGTAFIAMPLLRGESLAERLARACDGSASLPIAEVLRVSREIAIGLDAAHGARLIHRDIKPGNIWLEERTGRVKLLDFGLARAADGGDQLTQPGAMMGTPSYMAPEQARGDAVDARSDLFSLGCVMYQMAVGRRPFEGRDALSTLLAVGTQPARPPREINPQLPEAIERLILRLLEKDPAARIQSAEELIAQIRELESPTAQAPHVDLSSIFRDAEAVAVESPPQRPVRSPGGPPRKIRRITIAAAAAAACVLFGVIVIKIKHRDGTEDTITITSQPGGSLEINLDDLKKPIESALPEADVQGRGSPVDAVGARDRAAAEWVLAHGGSIGYVDEAGINGAWVTDIAKLPSAPFRLSAAILADDKTVQSADLNRFAALPRLVQLTLYNCQIDADAIPRLLKMPSLVWLGVSRTNVKSSQLTALAPLARLSDLTLGDRSSFDDGLAGLERLNKLRQLSLASASGEEIRAVGKFRQLRTLWLRTAEGVDEQAIADLRKSNPLCRVIVGENTKKTVGGDPVAELAKRLQAKGAKVDKQRFPDISQGVPTDAEIAAGMPFNIVGVELPAHASLDDDEIQWLSCMWPLQWFTALETMGADRWTKSLADQPRLGWINLRGSDLSDAGLQHFKALPHLKSLNLRGTKVTRARVEALRKALPECEVVWDDPKPNPTDKGGKPTASN